MSGPVRIRGGAGAPEAAAITAAVILLLAEEQAQRAAPAARPELSAWVTEGRFRELGPPRRSLTPPSAYSDPFRI